jgi:hypothetical protein
MSVAVGLALLGGAVLSSAVGLFSWFQPSSSSSNRRGAEVASVLHRTYDMPGTLFDSPLLMDEEDVKLKPVSVNTYVYVHPTLMHDGQVTANVMIEHTSELATEGY